MAASAHLTLAAPANEKFTVQSAPARLPRRKPNAEYRSREHLTEREVERLFEAVKGNRWRHRDATMVLVTFRHGLRASELVDLRWDQIDLEHALLHVRKLKNGSPATHPLTGKELRALRRLQREQDTKSPFVFTSERGTPFTKRGFQAMVERAGKATGFDMKIHPHMLRHACGFKLANDGVDTRTIQAYLGHKSIQHTVRYTELAPNSVQKFIPGLTAPAASFEATVGGSSCPRLAELFKKSRRMLDGSLFALKYLPPNEESRSSGRQGNKKRPLSTSPTKSGAPCSGVP